MLWTLWETRLANRAAIRAAQIALLAERPWITVELSSGGALHGSSDHFNAKILLVIENTGKSPATISSISYAYCAGIVGDTVDGRYKRDISFDKKYTLFPSGVTSQSLLSGFPLIHKKHGAYVTIFVKYKSLISGTDHFVKRRFTFHAANGPFVFSRDVELPQERWGLWAEPDYEVDS